MNTSSLPSALRDIVGLQVVGHFPDKDLKLSDTHWVLLLGEVCHL
jgi:hypothetical protein